MTRGQRWKFTRGYLNPSTGIYTCAICRNGGHHGRISAGSLVGDPSCDCVCVGERDRYGRLLAKSSPYDGEAFRPDGLAAIGAGVR